MFFFGYFNVYVYVIMLLHIPTDEGISQLRELQAQMAARSDERQVQQTPILQNNMVQLGEIQLEEKQEHPPN